MDTHSSVAAHNPIPIPPIPVLLVGQDVKGHWLVQDVAGRLEGCFISRETAIRFARAESGMLHATVQLADLPLTARAF